MWRNKRNRTIVTLAMLTIISGCAGNHAGFLLTPPLPEQIYQQPLRNYYSQGEMGVFVLGSPLYAPGVGNTAATTIFQQLLEQGCFAG